MIRADARRLPTRGEAYRSFSGYNQDRHKQHLKYHLILLLQVEQYGQYGRHVSCYPSQISFGTNSIYAFASLTGLGFDPEYKNLQRFYSERVFYVNRNGLLCVLFQFGGTVFCALIFALCFPDDIAWYVLISFLCFPVDIPLFFLYFHGNILYRFLVFALCSPDGTVLGILISFLYFPAYISYDSLTPHLYALDCTRFCTETTFLCSPHNTACDTLKILLCALHNALFFEQHHMFYTCSVVRLSYRSFCKRIQQWQGRSLDIWNISLEGDCRHGQTVVRYSQRNLLTGLAHASGCFCIDVRSINTALQRQQYLCVYYSTNQPVEQFYGLFSMLENM